MIRTLLVLACVAALLLAGWGLRVGWRHRAARQAGLPAPPQPPVGLGSPRMPPLTGVYVGTTFATSWQDRVVVHGLGARAEAVATLYDAGLVIGRQGAAPVFVPAAAVVAARLAPGLAGTVVGAGGLLVVRWRLGDAELDTGLRADDKGAYPDWVRALTPSLAARARRSGT